MSFFYDEELPAGFQDADLEQAELEAQGRVFAAQRRRSNAARARGDLEAAAEACPHGGGYPLDSPAAVNEGDPNVGESGVRCWDCGSRLSAFVWDGGVVTVPCEWKREEEL